MWSIEPARSTAPAPTTCRYAPTPARFGDLVTVKATATGTETLFIDADTLVGEPSRFAGREILFTSGPNAGQMRYITGSSRNDSAITLNRPLPYPTQEGDEADITNA